MSQEPTDKEVGQAALASLIGSAKLTPTCSTTSRRQSTNETGQSSTASAKLMGKLWVLMTDMYGHKWTSVHGEKDSGTWGKVLHDISGHQIAIGMQACATRTDDQAEWPPSAPEFRKMCLAGGSNLGIPDVAAAWREAVEASSDVINWKFSHPIVHEAARLTDWYSIRNGVPKAETVQNRFNKRYAELTAKMQRGEPLVDGQLLLGQEVQAGALEVSDKLNDMVVKQRIKDQGLDAKSPDELRAELRAKMGIKR